MFLVHCIMLGLNSQEPPFFFLPVKSINWFIKEHYRHGVCFILKLCGTVRTWPKSPQALRHRSPSSYYLFMQVMEVAVAVLDCPFMAAVSDLDDVNLKGKQSVLA